LKPNWSSELGERLVVCLETIHSTFKDDVLSSCSTLLHALIMHCLTLANKKMSSRHRSQGRSFLWINWLCYKLQNERRSWSSFQRNQQICCMGPTSQD